MRHYIFRACLSFAASLMVAATFASCVTDERELGGDLVRGEELTIRIAVPGNSQPSSRALTTADEYDVNEIEVLAFDADDKKFFGRYPGSFSGTPTHQSGTEAGATMTFHVSLPMGEFDLMVVANGNAMLNAASATLVKGASQSAVLAAVKMTMGTAGWDVDGSPAPLPMWGYKTGVNVPEDFTGADTSLSTAIPLTRMLAKVDIKLGTDLVAADKFKLETVRVYNYVEQGRLIPDIGLGNWDEGDDLTLNDTPTLPTGYTKASGYLEYTLTPGETSLVRSIYLFEAPAGISPVSDQANGMKNTCLIIGGRYNGGAKSWYRIDFTKDTDTNANDDVHNWVYMPILRNNAYFVTVTDVTGTGMGSATDALDSAPANINTSILGWANDKIKIAATNGIYMLGISQDAFVLSAIARTGNLPDNELIAVTNRLGGWTAKVWDDEAGTTATTASKWLTLSKYSVTGADNPAGTSVRLLTTTHTLGPSERTAWIHITAGVVTLKVKVTQEVPGVRNTGTADGVIGYIHHPGYPDHHKLTMKKDNGDDYDSDGIIYMAYFEFGSLVATSSQDHGDFTANDIIAWPNEWKSTTDDRAELNAAIPGSGDAAWALVPVVNAGDGLSSGKDILATVARVTAENGLGDPCQYYAADLGPGWRMPTMAENTTFVGGGSSVNGSAYYNWSLTGTASATNVGVGTFPQSPEGPTTSLLAAGYRDASGLKWQGQMGFYLTSTARDDTAGYTLRVNKDNVTVANPTSFPYGWSVRCIPTVTP